MNQTTVLIAGAGLSAAVLARQLADAGVACRIMEKDSFIGGMCHSRRDEETGVDVHEYGPHIFNTSNERVWDYVQRFDRFHPWVNRVKASNERGVFSFPINLHTINQLFNVRLTPSEARELIEEKRDKSITDPKNAEEKLLSMVGRDIYETFFKGYTIKQWGMEPAEMPADILNRIPVRFNYDDNYYFSRYQGFPMSGYTQWITNMLDHELITVELGARFTPAMAADYDHVFYCGPIDEYFDYAEGDLGYRTVTFKKIRGEGDLQGNGCINYSDLSVPYTRAHEHSYFSPWETHEKSIILQEYSHESTRADHKFYPKRTPEDMRVFEKYQALAEKELAERRVSFIGRLATYRYLDMQQCILMSLEYAQTWLDWKQGTRADLPCMPETV